MIERIRDLLASRAKTTIADLSYKESAVLIPIFHLDGEYYVLFTQRTQNLQHHKGQISFPGGRKDMTDTTLLATVLRECYEEIGLNPEDVNIIGELDDFKTLSSGFVISPFVGTIPYPYDFKTNLAEIERIIKVPLGFLLDEGNCWEERGEWNGEAVTHYSFGYEGDIIWGATGRILKHFLAILDPIRPHFVSIRPCQRISEGASRTSLANKGGSRSFDSTETTQFSFLGKGVINPP